MSLGLARNRDSGSDRYSTAGLASSPVAYKIAVWVVTNIGAILMRTKRTVAYCIGNCMAPGPGHILVPAFLEWGLLDALVLLGPTPNSINPIKTNLPGKPVASNWEQHRIFCWGSNRPHSAPRTPSPK